jgi:hypothetical protein
MRYENRSTMDDQEKGQGIIQEEGGVKVRMTVVPYWQVG